jgi:hypothetical protein
LPSRLSTPRAKGDVGGHRNADAGLGDGAAIEHEVDQRGDGDAADRAKYGQHSVAQVGQFAVVQLALEFETDQQEENRHQGVVDPMFDAQTSDIPVPEPKIALTERGIGECQRHQGADDQKNAAGLTRLHKFIEGFRELFFDTHDGPLT